MTTEDSIILKRAPGGAYRSNTFLQLNKQSRLHNNLGLKLQEGQEPELLPDYTALVVRARGVTRLAGNRGVEVETGMSIKPKHFYAMFTLSPEIVEIADVSAPCIIPPGVTYDVRLRLRLKDSKEGIDEENLPVLGYIFLVG